MRTIFLLALVLVFACEGEGPVIEPDDKVPECPSPIVTNGKYYTIGTSEYLWAGEDSTTHFNITGWKLDPCFLKYGLGREHFEVPNPPQFKSVAEFADVLDLTEKVVLLKEENNTKIYPYRYLRIPEMVNDYADGKPVMVVYCFLADLAAVYTRVYNGQELTFGVSGYTYDHPDELESFILWDRDTESLWWPITDEGVSGAFRDEPLIKHSDQSWLVTTWGAATDQHPNAQVFFIEGG